MTELSSPTGIVALAALAIGAAGTVLAIVLALQLRKVRAASTVVMGTEGKRDLVGHAAELHTAFKSLAADVEDAASRIDTRLDMMQHTLDRSFVHRGLVRYDAYGEMSGQQSSSIAILDTFGDGLVISKIAHRDGTHVYFRQIKDRRAEHELSPEERKAIERAMNDQKTLASAE